MNYRFFQLNIVCVLLIIVVSLSPNDDSQVIFADLNKTSSDSLSSSTRNFRGKGSDNVTTSSIKAGGSNVSVTTDVNDVILSSNVTSLPTRIPDWSDTFTNGTSPLWFNINSGALERTSFVALGLMSILLAFFVIRAVRVRHKKSKSRKYGIITSTASEMEMEPLEGRGDDDEEETLFDAHQKYLIK